MATKTISITEEAYGILKSRKEESDSFSDAIVKLSGKKALSDFFGALSEKSVDALEKSIEETRRLHKRRHEKRCS